MLPFSIFILSGAGIVTLTVSKRLEEKKKQPTLVLRAVSRGDERVREIHHQALHHYSHSKDRFSFWFKKQMPLKLKSFWNRFLAYMQNKSVRYLGDVRNSRLLKKSDGISEFFKNISEVEKGGGEINDEVYTIEPIAAPEPVITMTVEPVAHTTPIQKKSRAPRKKRTVRLTVVEEL